jgi:hypothetical protein
MDQALSFTLTKILGSGKTFEADNYMSNNVVQMSTFYLKSETHGGEDVSAYAIGPQAHIVTGVHEQSYLAHMVAYVACLRGDTSTCPAGTPWLGGYNLYMYTFCRRKQWG